MKFLITLALLATTALASSGIFDSRGNVVQPPSVRRDSDPVHVGRQTNSDRLARGLPPLAPKARWTSARGALKPRVSGTPGCSNLPSTSGYIKVSAGGTTLGYISKNFDRQKSYTYKADIAQALVVSLPSLNPFNTPIDITAVNGPDPAHPLVGAVGGSGGYNFNSGQVGYAYLAGTGHTNANSPPSTSAGTSIQSLGYNAPSESQIWTLSCSLALSAQWTNVDESQPPTSFFYDGAVDFVGLVGDFDKFLQTFPGEDAVLVSLSFVPIS